MSIPRQRAVEIAEKLMTRGDTSERMELRPDNEIQLSSRQIMEVALRNKDGEPVRLIRGVRLRGSVLNEYQGKGVWETNSHYKSTFETKQNQYTNLTPVTNSNNLLFVDVSLLQPMTKVYSLYRPVGLETIPPTRVSMNLANATMGLALGAIPLQTYSVQIDPEDVVVSPYSPKLLYYQNDDVRKLALDIMNKISVHEDELATSSDARRRVARAFENYLQSDVFEYSTSGLGMSALQRTEQSHPEDPIAMFLLQNKRGHCEFFAAAMVALCDTVKLPARIVTGFFTDRWVEESETYDVLERDAHAWVEVETLPLGWETYDPTPAEGDSPTAQSVQTYGKNVQASWEQFENAWERYVIDYNFALQKNIIVFADPYWRQHVRAVVSFVREMYRRIVDWFDIGAGGRLWVDLVMCALALAGFTFLIVRWRKKRTKKLLQLSARIDERISVVSVEFYARLQRVFAKHGLTRPSHVPTMTWVQSLDLPEDCYAIATSLSETYYAIRYGKYHLSRTERIGLLRTVRQFELLMQRDSQ
jgi:transglutaminase-like putative cysteine protease